VHAGRAQEAAQRFEPHARLEGASAAAGIDLDARNRAGLSLWWWRAGEQRSSAVQAWWRIVWR
jgi:hypothetical protein